MKNEKIRIHFILEGYEEEILFKIIKYFGNMDRIIFSYQNCKGGGLVPIYFQSAIQSDNYDLVLCAYDVDYEPFKEDGMFMKIRKGLYKVLGDDGQINLISLCTNPNILLILLLGYDDLSNFEKIHSDKGSNTEIIKKYCSQIGNKKRYDASEWQLELFLNDYCYYNKATIDKMLEQVDKLDLNYIGNKVGSNILPVIEALVYDNIDFFMKLWKNLKFNFINKKAHLFVSFQTEVVW